MDQSQQCIQCWYGPITAQYSVLVWTNHNTVSALPAHDGVDPVRRGLHGGLEVVGGEGYVLHGVVGLQRVGDVLITCNTRGSFLTFTDHKEGVLSVSLFLWGRPFDVHGQTWVQNYRNSSIFFCWSWSFSRILPSLVVSCFKFFFPTKRPKLLTK